MPTYDTKHWEGLIDTIVDRIGVEAFLEMTSYVLEQRGNQQLGREIGKLPKRLRLLEQMAQSEASNDH